MGAVVEIWFEYLIPFLLKDSHIVQWLTTTTRPEPTARTWRIRIFTGKMHDEKRKKENRPTQETLEKRG